MASVAVSIEPTTSPDLTTVTTQQHNSIQVPLSAQDSQALDTVDDDTHPIAAPSLRPSLSWKSFRSSLTFSEKTTAHLGWIVAFFGVVLTVITLSPAFKSQNLTERALELAEWTALKDFIEECREELAAGINSQACLRAINAKIPPPPYLKAGALDRARRGFLVRGRDSNGTHRASRAERINAVSTTTLGFAVIAITFASFVVWIVRGRYGQPWRARHSTEHALEERESSLSRVGNDSESVISTAIARHPPDLETNLRHRTVRTHPIYRHNTLDEAIHAVDLSEIRARLRNGEDVNQHWPYLIYRLAISNKAAYIAERMEVARLCLDLGADINGLDGWNGQSALLIAIHFGNVEVAKLLIANGATGRYAIPKSHLTALHRCVRLASTGSSERALTIMEMLFKYGANANQMDRLNETPMHTLLLEAWYASHDEFTVQRLRPVAKCLVEHGACMPNLLQDKFLAGNTLYDYVQSILDERTKLTSLGLGEASIIKLQSEVKQDDAELVAEEASRWATRRTDNSLEATEKQQNCRPRLFGSQSVTQVRSVHWCS